MTTTDYQARHGRAARQLRAAERAEQLAELDEDTRRQVMAENKAAYDGRTSR
jgi:hypothetical protein